jgi:uncharacterized protein YcbX
LLSHRCGIELQASGLAERGLQHDRGWMVIDAQNPFLKRRMAMK